MRRKGREKEEEEEVEEEEEEGGVRDAGGSDGRGGRRGGGRDDKSKEEVEVKGRPKQGKKVGRDLQSLFTDHRMNYHFANDDDQYPIEQYDGHDCIKGHLLQAYDDWKKNTHCDLLRQLGETEWGQTLSWFEDAEIIGKYIDIQLVNAFLWLLNGKNFHQRPDWTAIDTNFFGFMEMSNMTKNHDKPGKWDQAKLFVDRINGMEEFRSRRWYEVKYVLIPINYKGEHWLLGVFYVEEMRMEFYDSLESNASNESIDKWLEPWFRIMTRAMEEAEYWKKSGRPDNGNLLIKWERARGCPQQLCKSNDCGIFLYIFAQHYVEKGPFVRIMASPGLMDISIGCGCAWNSSTNACSTRMI
ncbi:uncharacterized protein [Euphorbia lathyris]|uniref:uncharacterized protein n=1 Tax=Euphorbia lathyris TaxID=212925 RepID=UPI00331401A0